MVQDARNSEIGFNSLEEVKGNDPLCCQVRGDFYAILFLQSTMYTMIGILGYCVCCA